MTWLDRLLMLLEILILLKMLKMDTTNSQAIQKFLQSRTDWYERRARSLPTKATPTPSQVESLENKKAPEVDPVPSEIVTVMQESEEEQSSNS